MNRASHCCSARRRAGACRLRQGRDPSFQGWVEADLIFVSPDEHGRVETLSVREGDRSRRARRCSRVDPDLQAADVEVAEATLANAEAGLRARAELCQDRGRHAEGLRRRGSGAARRAGTAAVGADAARAPQGHEPGRPAACSRSITAPANWCRPAGRWFRCCRPATSRCASSCRKPMLARIALGEPVSIRCDGCQAERAGEGHASSRAAAEFTPPVIYSLDERSKLVFLVEARTETPAELRVGQPVDVRL